MAAGKIAVTEGSGKNVRTFTRLVSASNVESEFIIIDDYSEPTYNVDSGNTSTATSASHFLQIMAGSSLNVRIRRITFEQNTNATTGAPMPFALVRLTTAGTGGTVVTPRPFDTGDAAAGATAMTLPTVKGTEGVTLMEGVLTMRQTVAAAGTQPDDLWQWVQMPNSKPIMIPAGTTNGLCLKLSAAIAAATALVQVEFSETSY